MSTRRSRQQGNKCIKAEDIQNYIYDSDEENENKTLIEANESKKKGVVKTGVDKETGNKYNRECPGNINFSEVNSQEWQSAKVERLNGSVEKWHEGSNGPFDSKLNNSVSEEEEIQKNNLVHKCLELGIDILSNLEGNIDSAESKNSDNFRKRISKQSAEESSDPNEENSLFTTVRKRPSTGDRSGFSVSKRSKVELDKDMSDTPAAKPLKIELELEKNRQKEPFKKRNINAITEELDEIGKRWHETRSKLKQSFQWGPRITKNCNEKWDFHYFPHKIVESYQNLLEGGYGQNPSDGETSCEVGDPSIEYKVPERGSLYLDSEKVDEEGFEALDYEQYPKLSGASNSMEDDLRSYNSEGHCHLTLRSSSQGRNRQDGRNSNDSAEQSKERASKKASLKTDKDQGKKAINIHRQLLVELELGPDPHRQHQNKEAFDSNRNLQDDKGNSQDHRTSSQVNSIEARYEENSTQGAMRVKDNADDDDNDDKVTCPICQLKFRKHEIETHASLCATEIFHD